MAQHAKLELDHSTITVSPREPAGERALRLKSEGRATLIADIKAAILFAVVLAAIIAIALICVRIVFFDAGAAPEARRWAETVLTALISGGFSFLVGKAIAAAP